jgi:endonuclease/exonuclease/phosphatase (EEP) superfamily protein YafD
VKRWLTRLGWAVTGGSAALLLFAYALPQDLRNTNTPYLVACAVAFWVRLLQFYLGLGLIVLGGCAVMSGRRKLAIVSAAIGAAAAAPMLWAAAPSRHWKAVPLIRVMSINVNASNRDAEAIDREVRLADPDIVVMQEFTDAQHSLLEKPFARFAHVDLSAVNFGLAVFSKIPLRARTTDAQLAEAGAARFEIDLAGSTAALYAVHLERCRSLETLRKGRLALATLLDRVAADPLPVIVAGDLNFTEETPNGAAIKWLGLRSCHSIAGHGLAVTRPLDQPGLNHLVGFRIDHVFIEPPLTSTRFVVGGATGSDHFPVIADIAWKSN